jgi:hypothetical protein
VPPLFNIQYVREVLEVATGKKEGARSENSGAEKSFGWHLAQSDADMID